MQQLQKPKQGYKIVKSLFGKYEEIPEDWKIISIKEIADVKGGKRLPKGEKFSNTKTAFPYIRVTDLLNNTVDLSNLLFLKEETREKIKRYTISVDDLYISIAGTIGLVGFIPKELDGANLTENAAKICNIQNISKDFLLYSLNSTLTQNQIGLYLSKSSQPKLALFRIEKLKIPSPPLPEQQKITSILSNVDSLINQTQKIIEQSQRLKKGLMQRLLTKGIGHTKFKKVTLFPRYNEETIPEDWNVDRLGNLIKIIDYRGRTPPFSESGILHLRSNNIRDGQINFEDITFVSEKTYEEYMTRGIPQEDDVLFTTEGPLGEVALVPKNFKFSLAQRIIVLRPKSKIIPKFLKYLLLDRKVRTRYEGLATGTTLGGIASKWFTKLFLPYPKDISEQEQIASILLNVESKIREHQEHKSHLETLKKGLMQKLLTGQIRVKI